MEEERNLTITNVIRETYIP